MDCVTMTISTVMTRERERGRGRMESGEKGIKREERGGEGEREGRKKLTLILL